MSLPDDAPCPRLCHLIKWPDFDGYGFNLHAEKTKTGQYIGKVDEDSPALLAGLREGDKIIEVNNVNICNENHRQVVERIKSMPNETKLLVADEEMEKWYRDRELVIKSSQANVIHYRTPVPRPQGTGLLPIPLSTVSLMTNGKSADDQEERKSENGGLVRQESVSASLKSGSISEVSQASSDLASAVHSNHTNHQQQVQVDVEPCVTPTKNGGGGDLSRATSSVSGTASVEDLGASGQSSWLPSSPHPLASASVAAAVSSSTTTSSSLNHTDHHHSSYHSSSPPSTTPLSLNDGRGSPTNSHSSATLPPASPPHSINTGASGQLFQSNSIISSNDSEGKNSLHSSSNGGSVERINGNGTGQVNGNHSSLSASPSAEGGGSVDSLSGDFLNLNMTASQMRALLAQRKKKNIKEDNIDIMEKFRKLQQL